MSTAARRSAAASGLAAVLFLASCTGQDDPPQADDRPTSDASSTASYVENETCRRDMKALVDIGLANVDDSLGYYEFSNRVEQLRKRAERAVAACGDTTNLHLRKAIYRYGQAELWWSLCDSSSSPRCHMGEIKRGVLAGNRAIKRTQRALEATDS